MTLCIPEITPDMSNLDAALAYAEAGWFVVPTDPAVDGKNPGSVVGDGWQRLSSRDAKQIAAWFAGTDYGIALHCGRSGALVFDVDHYERIPDVLGRYLDAVPHQSSRPDQPRRGHYVFAQPADRTIGNGKGELSGPWGEVRGLNGAIIAAPTPHRDGGCYEWLRGGLVPPLPDEISAKLPTGSAGQDAATDAQVAAFLNAHNDSQRPEILHGFKQAMLKKIEAGESRHDTAVSVVTGALKEARAGYYPAQAALDTLKPIFVTAVSLGANKRTDWAAATEWAGIVAWAVAQASAADLEVVRARTEAKMPARVESVEADAITPGQPEVISGGARYFNQAGLRARTLLDDCERYGPIASGIDGKVWVYLDGVWVHGDRVLRSRVVDLLGERYRRAHADTVESMVLAREPFITDTPARDYLNVTNGLLDWRTGQLRPHTPEVPSTTRIPVRWNPEAVCPHTDEFLDLVVGPQCRPILEEVAGYALYPDQPLHKAVMLDGKGRNGKGTYLRMLTALLGRANIAAAPPQRLDTDKWAVAQLYGKLANLVGDVDPRTFKETATFKQATGQDLLQGEHKYGAPFTFTSRALIVAAFNSLPRSVDTTEGFFSRWLVVPFPHRFAEPDEHGHVPPGCLPKDPDLGEKLTTAEELEGFLVRAVAGLRRVMDTGRFSHAEAVTRAESEFRRHADPVRGFLAEAVIAARDGWVSRASLHAGFRDWATDNNIGVLSAKRFAEKVREVHTEIFGYPASESKRTGDRGWSGIRLRNAGDDQDDDAEGHQGHEGHLPLPPPPHTREKGRERVPSAPSAPAPVSIAATGPPAHPHCPHCGRELTPAQVDLGHCYLADCKAAATKAATL